MNILNSECIQILFILTIAWNSCNFYTNLSKSDSTQNLYERMKHGKFVMLLLCIIASWNVGVIIANDVITWDCCCCGTWKKKKVPIDTMLHSDNMWELSNRW